jgi:nucleoside-diphosphate-sugar epimerase
MDIDPKQRIVILGAAGFIGFHLAKYLHLNCKSELLIIDDFSRGKPDKSFEELSNLDRVKFIELDLSLEASYIDLFLENDIVINCAAYNGTQNFYSKPVQVIRNSGITAALAAEFCAKAKVKNYVYFASPESYAGGVSLGFTSIPTDEKVPLVIEDVNNPRWSYAASKTFGEVSTIANHHQFNLNFIILRIHNVYGPRMGYQHVIPDLIEKFKNGNTEVHGVDESRAFFYVNDLSQIVFSLIFNKGIRNNIIYNVGSTKEIKVEHLARMILEEMGLKLTISPMPSFMGSVSRRCPDTSLIRDQVAYQETDLKQGLKSTISWYLTNGV